MLAVRTDEVAEKDTRKSSARLTSAVTTTTWDPRWFATSLRRLLRDCIGSSREHRFCIGDHKRREPCLVVRLALHQLARGRGDRRQRSRRTSTPLGYFGLLAMERRRQMTRRKLKLTATTTRALIPNRSQRPRFPTKLLQQRTQTSGESPRRSRGGLRRFPKGLGQLLQ